MPRWMRSRGSCRPTACRNPPKPLFQESGTRFSRSLPYELHVNAAVKAGISIELRFGNTGTQGAVFHVYDKLHLDRIPRRYTVEAGKALADVWDLTPDRGAHELWVYGPNGFVRIFKDDAMTTFGVAAAPEIEVAYDVANGDVVVTFSNSGTEPCMLYVEDKAYRAGGRPRVRVAPGRRVEHSWSLRKSAHWYDFSVTADELPGFERRFAGRVETGKHGLSDPALGTA